MLFQYFHGHIINAKNVIFCFWLSKTARCINILTIFFIMWRIQNPRRGWCCTIELIFITYVYKIHTDTKTEKYIQHNWIFIFVCLKWQSDSITPTKFQCKIFITFTAFWFILSFCNRKVTFDTDTKRKIYKTESNLWFCGFEMESRDYHGRNNSPIHWISMHNFPQKFSNFLFILRLA